MLFLTGAQTKMGSLHNMKTWHVTVFGKVDGKTKILFQKQCNDVREANTLFAEKKIEFPAPAHQVLKEHF